MIDNYTEFKAWPKTARLNRDIVITEKIDGTNGAVLISIGVPVHDGTFAPVKLGGDYFSVRAQSRNRLIWPGQDNYGFAKWVFENAEALVGTLGVGRHFGEWWGSGIQTGYGLEKGDKRFSLFNVKRYADSPLYNIPGLDLVPVLYEGPFDGVAIDNALGDLAIWGSAAAPGFMNPEGIIVFHTAANTVFKVTLKNDEAPKSVAGAA